MKIVVRLLPFAVILAAVFVLWELSTRHIVGMPETVQKNVTVSYPPHSDAEGVSIFLQPPMATLQFENESQVLGVQFINHTAKPVDFDRLKPYPADCFDLQTDESFPVTLQPKGSRVLLYKLLFQTKQPNCLKGQPLTLSYQWAPQVTRTRPIKTKKHSRRRRSIVPAPPPPPHQVTVSTSPILISTPARNGWERFYHAGGAILVPLLLGVLTFLFQEGQRQRDERAKEQDFKLEVWKQILPDIVKLTTKHYSPISRRMTGLRNEIKKDSASEATLIAALLLRRQVKALADINGGFYFRSSVGEQMCSRLSDVFWENWYEAYGRDQFHTVAEYVKLTDNIATARLSLVSRAASRNFRILLTDFKAKMATEDGKKGMDDSRIILCLMTRVLDFECNRPLYPEWYEEAPEFIAKNFSFDGLSGAVTPLLTKKKLPGYLKLYLESIPPECIKPKKPLWKRLLGRPY